MAVPDITKITFGGQVDGNGAFSTTHATQNALFARTFGGEILTEFREATVFRDTTLQRSIAQGKAAKFPVFGNAGTSYFAPGDSILEDTGLLQNIQRNEKLIYINDLCISSVFVDELDEMKDDYNGVRQIYASELGRALANKYDTNIAHQIVLGANADSLSAAGPKQGAGDVNVVTVDLVGGTTTDDPANDEEAGDRIVAAIYDMAAKFDNFSVPQGERVVVLKPDQYYLLVQSAKAINRDYGGAGSMAGGQVLRVGGFDVMMSVNIPTAYATSDGDHNDGAPANSGTFAGTFGVAYHKSAVGTVSMMDLGFEQEYLINRQGHLLVAKMAVGHGYLRPEACGQFIAD